MTRLLCIALLLATTASCGSKYSCSKSVKLTFTYDAKSKNADTLTIDLSGSVQHGFTKPHTPGRTVDTLEVLVADTVMPFTVTVLATLKGATVGAGSATYVRSGCPSQPMMIAVTAPTVGTLTCNCGSGPCALGATCDTTTGACSYPRDGTQCTTCSGGQYYSLSDAGCFNGRCAPAGAGMACANAICGDTACASPNMILGSLVTGNGFSCVSLGPTNEVRCWGSNAHGVLGNSVTTLSPTPHPVPGTTGILTLAAGDDFVCGVTASGVLCWGGNESGQLGLTADKLQHPTPTMVPGLPSGVPAAPFILTASSDHACVAASGGSGSFDVYCWGNNHVGEIGPYPGVVTPHALGNAQLQGVSSLAIGDSHLCGAFWTLTEGGAQDASVNCVGSNAHKQLGSDVTTDPQGSQLVPVLSQPQLAAGGNTTCAFQPSDGPTNIYCWGTNAEGELGTGALRTSDSATMVSPCAGHCGALGTVAVGKAHVCAGFADGVYCWGLDSNAQLGFLPASGSSEATFSEPTGTALAIARGFVAAGFDHSCAIGYVVNDTSPSVHCWGDSDFGQTGSLMNGDVTAVAPSWGGSN